MGRLDDLDVKCRRLPRHKVIREDQVIPEIPQMAARDLETAQFQR
jgi:hypothetical protein